MTNTRYNELMDRDDNLTVEEINRGWHFCVEFDGLLLVGPDSDEIINCICFEPEHPLYARKQEFALKNQEYEKNNKDLPF